MPRPTRRIALIYDARLTDDLKVMTGFSVSKRFPLGVARLEFRAEIFNLINTTNFGQPDGNITNVTAGVISSADDARSMQFGIRLAW